MRADDWEGDISMDTAPKSGVWIMYLLELKTGSTPISWGHNWRGQR
jgi:hypothetical protein